MIVKLMLIDTIKNDERFEVKEQEFAELYSLVVYKDNQVIFNDAKIKCPYESMRNLKQLINAKLENKLKTLNLI